MSRISRERRFGAPLALTAQYGSRPLAAGYTAEQIIEQYDHLTREDIQACLPTNVIRSSPQYHNCLRLSTS
ncbi:MAG: DUF433 domain-containing protein [Acidobacteria bacterium]|nr:DUF433 domain-containing protein [Acidobacteriota bacterium]